MVWLTAWYSAERCTHSTALRLSSATTSAVVGFVSVAVAGLAAGAAGTSVRLQAPSASVAARREIARTVARMVDPGCEGHKRRRRRPSVAKHGDAPMTAPRCRVVRLRAGL